MLLRQTHRIKFITVFLLLFAFSSSLFCNSSTNASLSSFQDSIEQKDTAKTINFGESIHLFGAVLSLANLCLLKAITKKNKKFSEMLDQQLTKENILKNFAYNYTTRLNATFFHELGHALASKIFTGNPIDIHIGSASKQSALIKTKQFSFNPLLPMRGQAQVILPKQKAQRVITLLAGGLTGCLGHFLYKTIAYLYQKKVSGKASVHPLSFDYIYRRELANAFIPLSETSDAARMYQLFGFNDQFKILAAITYTTEYILTAKNIAKKYSLPFDEAAMFTMVNAGLEGYFQLDY